MYQYPIRPYEIYHYGMPERSGRYAWGTGDRPYQRLEGKAIRMEKRLRKRFDKSDKKTSQLQEQASRHFNRANQRRNSIFKSQRKKADKEFQIGYESQEKKERIEYRTSSMYQRYLNKFNKLDLKMDKDLKKKGLDYYNRVIKASDTKYKAALAKRIQ